MHFFYTLIESVSFLIGLFGVGVIAVGTIRAARSFIRQPNSLFHEERKFLAEHLVLGLDFLVCKDVIDTLLLDSGSVFWEDLVGLITVVVVRIILTHFTLKELNDIVSQERKVTQKNSRKKSVVTKKIVSQ